MNKLDAINEILTRGGLRPVPTLDTAGRSDAALAEMILDEMDVKIQGNGGCGWSYNVRENVELEYDGDGYVLTPAGTIWIRSGGQDYWRDLVQLGGKLYDRDNNTDVFTANVYCDYCLRYEFECIPYEIQQYLVLRSAQEFVQRHGEQFLGRGGMITRMQLLQQPLRESRRDAKRFEANTGSHNVLATDEHHNRMGRRRRFIGGW